MLKMKSSTHKSNVNLCLVVGFVVLTLYSFQLSAQTDSIVTGVQSRYVLQSNDWFSTGYANYEPKIKCLNKLFDAMPSDIKITIVMGTWCSDSRREVPRFYKLADALQIPNYHIRLILVDKKKTAAGTGVDKLNMRLVPTFIIYDSKGNELGRIIESPHKSLERDLLQILKKAA